MQNYNFDKIINRKNTNSLKWDFISLLNDNNSTNAIPLSVADMDFRCSDAIISALKEHVEHGIFGYSMNKDDNYISSVTGWFKRQYDWDIDKKSIYYSPGIIPAISFLIRILTNEGDGVIIQPPVYYSFSQKIIANHRKVVNNPLIYSEDNYTMNFEDLECKLMNSSNKILLFCSPHNPVGRVWRKDELKRVVELCEKYGTIIISDEIHCDITREGITHIPLEKLCPHYKNKIITCTSPSKSFNIPGFQISNIIINNQETAAVWNNEIFLKNNLGLPNPLSIVAVKAAYNHSEGWLLEVKKYINDNIKYVEDFMKENLPKAKFISPEGTFLVWIDFSEYISDHKVLENIMLKKADVITNEGYLFGEEGKCFERINIACPRKTLTKGLETISTAITHHHLCK